MKSLLTLCLLILFLPVGSGEADELTVDEFERIHAEIVPVNETWKTIPWHTDLLSAQAAAVERKKPIFIWSMDGHPLGCT